jgi:hypothetical protein
VQTPVKHTPAAARPALNDLHCMPTPSGPTLADDQRHLHLHRCMFKLTAMSSRRALLTGGLASLLPVTVRAPSPSRAREH